jgi:hypothetical protein
MADVTLAMIVPPASLVRAVATSKVTQTYFSTPALHGGART